ANRIDLPGKFLRRIERLDGMRQYALRVAHAAEYVVHCRGVAFFESFCEIHLPPPSRLRTPGGGRASISSFQLSVPLRNLRHPYGIPWHLCERAPTPMLTWMFGAAQKVRFCRNSEAAARPP